MTAFDVAVGGGDIRTGINFAKRLAGAQLGHQEGKTGKSAPTHVGVRRARRCRPSEFMIVAAAATTERDLGYTCRCVVSMFVAGAYKHPRIRTLN